VARPRRLRRAELPTDTVALARYLIGALLVRDFPEDQGGGRVSGRIVETEAYLVGDAACHAFRGPTPRNRSLFLARGHAYVYFIYGVSFMMNISSEAAGIGAGVLLRALEPVEGVEAMAARRGASVPLRDLARGPGRLATAFGIDRTMDGLDLCAKGSLWLAAPPRPAGPIGASVRIGLSVEQDPDRVLRFYERGNRFVSGVRRLSP
jgi:DNA-3-methyladenine glycosylase